MAQFTGSRSRDLQQLGQIMRIVLIENKSVTEAFRQQFEHFWKNGKPVSHPVYMEKK
jgi:hypothetical protein